MSTVNSYYFLYRFYSPNLQRWLNQDPLGEPGFENILNISIYQFLVNFNAPFGENSDIIDPQYFINLYDYSINSPIDITDTDGQLIWPLSWIKNLFKNHHSPKIPVGKGPNWDCGITIGGGDGKDPEPTGTGVVIRFKWPGDLPINPPDQKKDFPWRDYPPQK